jgi:hypothetical protein
MTQDWASIRDAIKAVVAGVSGVEIVHGFPRLDNSSRVGSWKELMTTNSRIDAWTILRTGAPVNQLTGGCLEVFHQVTIRAVMEHRDEDASQDEFDARLDAVMMALQPHITLTGTATHKGPAQLLVEDFRIVAETLVHYAEITTVVNQTVTVTGIT